MIRHGRLEDIPSILTFAEPFVRQLPGPPREPETVFCRQYLQNFVEAPQGALFVSDDDGVNGFIAGTVSLDPFTGVCVAMKSSWIVDPERAGSGLKLLSAFEDWARDEGAQRMICSHLVGSIAIGMLLERRGYARTEITYERLL